MFTCSHGVLAGRLEYLVKVARRDAVDKTVGIADRKRHQRLHARTHIILRWRFIDRHIKGDDTPRYEVGDHDPWGEYLRPTLNRAQILPLALQQPVRSFRDTHQETAEDGQHKEDQAQRYGRTDQQGIACQNAPQNTTYQDDHSDQEGDIADAVLSLGEHDNRRASTGILGDKGIGSLVQRDTHRGQLRIIRCDCTS